MILNEIENIPSVTKNNRMYNSVAIGWKELSSEVPLGYIEARGHKFGIFRRGRHGVMYIYALVDITEQEKNPNKKMHYAMLASFVIKTLDNLGDVQQAHDLGVTAAYRGWGLPVKLYSWLVKKGIILVSSDIQSPGGRIVWERLIASPGIHTYIYDPMTNELEDCEKDPTNEDIWETEYEEEKTELQHHRRILLKQKPLNIPEITATEDAILRLEELRYHVRHYILVASRKNLAT